VTANKNRLKQTKEAKLNRNEVWLLRLILNRPIGWAQVYCKAVDTLMEKGFIEWDHEDERGMYYNSIRITETGKTALGEIDDAKTKSKCS
jgi:hypothetical protein